MCTTRTALGEIPDRFDGLRVATPDEHHPVSVFNNTILLDNETNVALARDSMPSPDELIIRQRGRRRTTCSADDPLTPPTPFQRTPTKVLTTAMILRSSPRKRLSMGTAIPDPTPYSPSKMVVRHSLFPDTPIMKKQRLDCTDCEEEQPSIAQSNTETALTTMLQGLSQQQLIDLIVKKLVANDAKIEEKLRKELPMPDIEPMEQMLMQLKRNIYKSLPTSRLCRKTDSVSYARAALHLSEFKRVLDQQAKQLHDSEHWDALLDYVSMAWAYVRATPIFDCFSQNAVRRQCFKSLSCYCIAAVKNGGLRLGDRLQTLERNLKEFEKDYENVICCVNTLNKVLTKGRTSI